MNGPRLASLPRDLTRRATFRGLSRNARNLYLALAASTYGGALPGVLLASRAELLHELQWPKREFEAGVSELESREWLYADLDAGLVVLGDELERTLDGVGDSHVQAWAKTWPDVPSCELRRALWDVYDDGLAFRGKLRAREIFVTHCPREVPTEGANDNGRRSSERLRIAKSVPPPPASEPAPSPAKETLREAKSIQLPLPEAPLPPPPPPPPSLAGDPLPPGTPPTPPPSPPSLSPQGLPLEISEEKRSEILPPLPEVTLRATPPSQGPSEAPPTVTPAGPSPGGLEKHEKPRSLSVEQARGAFVAGVREVLGEQWRMPPGNHDAALRALVVWLGSQSPVAGADEALKLLRRNVRRFATAERGSPLVVKHYDPARCTRWLEENGIDHLPVPKVRPSVHAPLDAPPMTVSEKLAGLDDVLLRLRGIQGPGVAKSRDEQLAELERLEKAAQ